MIIVTGGAGFIGSAIVWHLNRKGYNKIIIVDHLKDSDKWKNLCGLSFLDYIEKDDFIRDPERFLSGNVVQSVIHMGACSATTEKDVSFLIRNNFEYSKTLAKACAGRGIYFLYASSAATYGNGELGFSDSKDIDDYRPLNPYGFSKQIFDLWCKRNHLMDKVTGLKFFNVFGPNEYHKGSMRSVACKAYEQIKKEKSLKLFKSHRSDFAHGGQLRDFVYIKDALEIFYYIWINRFSGIWNVGTGKARSFEDLGKAIFNSMNISENIEYIDMPESIRNQYQYFTEGDMKKLENSGFPMDSIHSLEESIDDYVRNYLNHQEPFLGEL